MSGLAKDFAVDRPKAKAKAKADSAFFGVSSQRGTTLDNCFCKATSHVAESKAGWLFPQTYKHTDTQTHQRGKVYCIRLFSARLAAPPRHRPLLPRPPPPRPLPRRSELSSTMRRAIAGKDSHRHDVSLFADAFCTGTDAVLYPELITYPNPAFGRRFVRSFSQVCYVTS